MNGVLARVAAVLLFVLAAVLGGWGLHSVIAERDALAVQVDAQRDRIADLQAARAQDHANAQRAEQAEQQRIDLQAKRDTHFEKLQQDIDKHAQDPGRNRGNADSEFLRIWREANAGRSP